MNLTKTIPAQPETNAMAQNTQDTTAQNITSTLDVLHLEPPITPPETVESLRAYEKEPGEAQKFLGTTKFALHTLIYFVSLTDVFADRMVHGFASMPDNIRSQVFWGFTDDLNFNAPGGDMDREVLYFYNSLEAGKFDEHQKDWVLVNGQKVVKYGSDEYTNQQLTDLQEEIPAAIYIPVDPLLRGKYHHLVPAPRMVKSWRSNSGEHLVRVKRVGSEDESSIDRTWLQFPRARNNITLYRASTPWKKGWHKESTLALGYGVPSRLFLACDPFLVSIGDNNGWSHWVQTNTLRVWEPKPASA
ncbi:1527_t:CDS:2 [Paraglomus brasilianum]|uniref:1527_t:CDS:1 n=1 Tax=Paraglomus brasilianum TaxID=144538 RepID=A0A9N9CFA3_9GLOM|nr:1527_t:CDS:2 [Paraglomus brasilianum]